MGTTFCRSRWEAPSGEVPAGSEVTGGGGLALFPDDFVIPAGHAEWDGSIQIRRERGGGSWIIIDEGAPD